MVKDEKDQHARLATPLRAKHAGLPDACIWEAGNRIRQESPSVKDYIEKGRTPAPCLPT
ncbi:terpene synthase family protein [Chitinophaga sedimenti]|nr:terpene synthase family protein [Chitinophaga sedimenti]MCK7558171.1 terpene synthase family protein [Chitinophaga sedimenti]